MYECHITVMDNPKKRAEWKRIARSQGWSTSWITNDPAFGKGKFFYFTIHRATLTETITYMRYLEDALRDIVIRSKIEQVIYDTKTNA